MSLFSNMMGKRQRGETGYSSDRKRKIAIAIAARERSKYPYTQYGKAHLLRGSAISRRIFGPTYKEADAQQKDFRKQLGFTGRGLYWGRAGGSAIGGALGSRIGMESLGSKVGGYLGDKGSDWLMSKFSGRGLYHHTNNLIQGQDSLGLTSGRIPTMMGKLDETGAVTISHREFVQDIFGPGTIGGSAVAFSNQAYSINPAIQQSFLWLSQIASNFEEYEFKQLIYHFRSVVSESTNNTSGQVGTLIMCTNYNAAAPLFNDKQTMVEYAHAHSCRITETMSHGVECDPRKNAISGILYTRTNPVLTGQDLKTYDMGTFQIAVSNCPSAYNGYPIGELWVEYSVELRKPKLFVARGLEIDQDLFTMPVASAATGSSPFGTNQTISTLLTGQQNNIGCTLQGGTNFVDIFFPPYFFGAVEVEVTLTASATVTTAAIQSAGALLTGNIVALNDILGNSSTTPIAAVNAYIVSGGGAGSNSIGIYHFFVTGSTQGVTNKIRVQFVNGCTSTCIGTLAVRQYNSYDKSNFKTTGLPVYVNNAGNITAP